MAALQVGQEVPVSFGLPRCWMRSQRMSMSHRTYTVNVMGYTSIIESLKFPTCLNAMVFGYLKPKPGKLVFHI